MHSKSKMDSTLPISPQWFRCSSCSTITLVPITMWVIAQMVVQESLLRIRLATNWWSMAMWQPHREIQEVIMLECRAQRQPTRPRAEVMRLRATCIRWWIVQMSRLEQQASMSMVSFNLPKIMPTTRQLQLCNRKAKKCQERATVQTQQTTTRARSSLECQVCGIWQTSETTQRLEAIKLGLVVIKDGQARVKSYKEVVEQMAKIHQPSNLMEYKEDANHVVVPLIRANKEKFCAYREGPQRSEQPSR